ncbi:hypothetical protein DER46DRAFT_575854 [Fusarium sp. MPI-SDFR-AT-0072]|nr:hypothetical protein DER46DRAFT_575854 [Fusarium sp. MPI-SDFR-AT-0072]
MDDLTTKTSGGNEVRVYLSEYYHGAKQIWVARNFTTDKHLNTSHSILEVGLRGLREIQRLAWSATFAAFVEDTGTDRMPSFRFLHGTPRIASIREPGLASFVRLESGQKLVVDHQKTTVPDKPWTLILISVDLRQLPNRKTPSRIHDSKEVDGGKYETRMVLSILSLEPIRLALYQGDSPRLKSMLTGLKARGMDKPSSSIKDKAARC